MIYRTLRIPGENNLSFQIDDLQTAIELEHYISAAGRLQKTAFIT